ncbi:glycosyltransferase family 4 protein [Pseudomonas chengduensis]|nr:glycosyltransferase family 1 protein [Pseudomonas chengduensis]MDH1282226.1 glycosyltransferase family 4 protein [Pseudomonas chengduensis]MDH1681894.1 glycosyltransferase family 4 protein [Pseudomonas chengduensis]
MRIGLDYRMVASAPMSGISRQVLAMERVLRELPDVELIRFAVAPRNASLREEVFCPPWECPSASMHQPHHRLRFEASFLPHELRQKKIDLHIANFNMGLPLPPKPAGIRYALVLHDLFQITMKNYHANRLKAGIYRASDRLSIAYAVRAADRIWTPSQFTADEVARLFPGCIEKVRVLPNLVEGGCAQVGDMSERLPSRYWLVVGTRELRKNVPWFVEAWSQARRESPQVPELVLVGSLEHLPMSQRQLPGLYAFSGLDDSQLQSVYMNAQRLWQPSYAEGFGLPVVEALSLGVPVAVATGSSLGEVAPIDSPRFSPVDARALQELMHRLASAPAEDSGVLREWAKRFGLGPYRNRLIELITEVSS